MLTVRFLQLESYNFVSHTKYHTEAIIMKSFNIGENDRFLRVLTRDFGLLGLQARGSRKLSSKQRYFLKNLSVARLSLVKGKSFWRLTNVSPSKIDISDKDMRVKILRGKTLKFVDRLVHGEGQNNPLFYTLISGWKHSETLNDPDDFQALENIINLNTLYHLGYMDDQNLVKNFIGQDIFSRELIKNARDKNKTLSSLINESLDKTGL